MTIFYDPQFWVTISFLICVFTIGFLFLKKCLTYLDDKLQYRQNLLKTLEKEEAFHHHLLEQEKQKALNISTERKLIKQQLKHQMNVLRRSMQKRTQVSIKEFEHHYAYLQKNIREEFLQKLRTDIIDHIIAGTIESLNNKTESEKLLDYRIEKLKI